MPFARLVSHAELANLRPVFDRIRQRAGIQDGYQADAYFEAESGERDDEPTHVVDTRADRTAIELVTIDPAGSRDLDQAIAVEARGDGFRVHYAIADVGAHVIPGGALDRDTRQRVETVYCPDHRIGLHPPVMSEGYASLLPGQRRKAVVWELDVAASGELEKVRVERAWVRSRVQYSYEQLHAAAPPEAEDLVAALRRLGDARRALSQARGAVTLPKPSQEVVEDGDRLRLEFRTGLPIEDDNAQVSLMTGEAAASVMLDGGLGILRTMPEATEGAIRRLRHQARALGVPWAAEETYGQMLQHVDRGAPATAAFLTEAVTLFRGARWEAFDDADPAMSRPEHLTHGALAVPYAHVTAPLRRLADRFATEACLAHAAGRAVPDWVRGSLPWIGEEMARGVRVNKKVDRECIDAVEAAMLSGSVGHEFVGVGLDDDTVQLAEPAVVAKCGGGVVAGEEQAVRLISARLDAGPRFVVAAAPPVNIG